MELTLKLAEDKKFVRSYENFFKKRRRRKDQATKSIRRMPWYMAPKKDVTSCEKLREGANIL